MTTELYIFSGLGADERVFQRLDFSRFKATFIKWIPPQKNESISQYASRLVNQIHTVKPTLIGLSFGGLIAIEVAKQIDADKVIVIASAKTSKEIPFYFRLAGKLRLHKLLPSVILRKSNSITNWLFGVSSPVDKMLLKQILIDTDPAFLKWAIDKVVTWDNQALIKNILHVHGTSDRILPIRFVSNAIPVKNGGHLMTLNKADQLYDILGQHL